MTKQYVYNTLHLYSNILQSHNVRIAVRVDFVAVFSRLYEVVYGSDVKNVRKNVPQTGD